MYLLGSHDLTVVLQLGILQSCINPAIMHSISIVTREVICLVANFALMQHYLKYGGADEPMLEGPFKDDLTSQDTGALLVRFLIWLEKGAPGYRNPKTGKPHEVKPLVRSLTLPLEWLECDLILDNVLVLCICMHYAFSDCHHESWTKYRQALECDLMLEHVM
jgi:hypothetical protein